MHVVGSLATAIVVPQRVDKLDQRDGTCLCCDRPVASRRRRPGASIFSMKLTVLLRSSLLSCSRTIRRRCFFTYRCRTTQNATRVTHINSDAAVVATTKTIQNQINRKIFSLEVDRQNTLDRLELHVIAESSNIEVVGYIVTRGKRGELLQSD